MCRADYSVAMFRLRPRIPHLILLIGLSAGLCGCKAEPAEKTYALRGQILAVAPETAAGRGVTVKHEDIPNFMPAMTMAYYVRPPAQLDGFVAGDVITADLKFTAASGDTYLTNLKKAGHATLPADAQPVKIMDVMNPGDEVPDDPLQDQTGAARRLSDWRGRTLAVTFVYTRCPLPDFCPLMDRHFGALQRAIASDAGLRDRVHLVSISFDPAHDTPAVIAAHANAKGADPRTWSYLTGSAAALDRLTSRFGVSTISDKNPAQTLTHNLRTAIVDPKGRLVKVLSGHEWTVDQLLSDLRDAGR